MKTTLSIATLVAGITLLSCSSYADEVAAKDADRPEIRDERPDQVRGWVVLSRSAYWPLAYEALDRLTEVRDLAASNDKDAIAEGLEKCSSWLGLAASAAMVDDEARIYTIADNMDDVSASLRDGDPGPSQREIEALATMGELAIAKSHLIRAAHDSSRPQAMKTQAVKKGQSETVSEAEKDIRKARIERDIDQYRYDTNQSIRHLEVAQAYLKAVAKQGEIDLGDMAGETVARLTGEERMSELTPKDLELRMLVKRLTAFVVVQQDRLSKEFKWQAKSVEANE